MSARQTARLIGATAAAGALVLGTMTPAQAALPVWPTTGYHPTCDSVVAIADPPSGTAYVYWDLTKPTITGLSAPTVIKTGNSSMPNTKLFTVFGKDSCSGVGGYAVTLAFNGVPFGGTIPITQSRGSWFNGSGSHYTNIGAGQTGKFTYPTILAYDRFSSFALSGDFKTLLGSSSQSSSPATVRTTDAYRNTATYLLHDVRTTIAANKTSIKKGTKVYVGGKFTRATGSSYVNLSGATIVLQRRDKGSTKWVNVASAKTNSSGNVSIGSAPSKTADFRLSYSGIYKSPWYAPALTSSKRVSVS